MNDSGMMRATRAALAAAALCCAATLAAPAAAADIEVQVATADGKKFTGTLYAAEQVLPVESAKAKLTVRDVDTKKRLAVAVDLAVADAKGKPPLRYVGVAEYLPGRGPLQVKAEPVKDMNAFCSTCHPADKEPVKEGQIVRDLHATGQEIAGRYLAQVGRFNKEYIEKKRKEGKERPPEPVVLEERIVVVNGKEVKKYFSTCESCHTLHWKTPWEKYARAAFREKGTLCAGCHF